MKVVFSDRAYAAIMAETTEKITTETGGLFLGTIDKDTWYVIEAIDPGPNSIFEVAYFEYDQKYTQHLINKIANLYDEKLQLIGLWHRHPGSFDSFSTTDNGTNAKYAQMRPMGAISALVNVDPSFRLTVYHVDQPYKYTKTAYIVGNDLIPDKFLRLKTPQKYEQIMNGILASQNDISDLHPSVSFKSFMEGIAPYFADRRIMGKTEFSKTPSEATKNKLIDGIISDLDFMTETLGIELQILQQNGLLVLLQNSVDGVEKVFFVYDSNNERILFQYDHKKFIYEEGLFENMYGLSVDTFSDSAFDEDEEEDGEETETPEASEEAEEPPVRLLDSVRKIIKFDRRVE